MTAPVPRRLVVAFALAPLAFAHEARADDMACFDHAERGQELRNAGKLIEARARFIACSNGKQCPEAVTSECARWLAEVEERMPTVVFGARDEAGIDLLDVRVSIDGQPSRITADGRPVPIDPGPHTIRFDHQGRSSPEQTVIVRAGEKNRTISTTFGAAPVPSAAPVAPAGEPARPARSIPTLSWVLAGVSVVGFGMFGYFGATGVSDYDRFRCDVGCAPNDKSKVDTAFVVADVGLGVGLVALTGAVIAYLVQPKTTASTASR